MKNPTLEAGKRTAAHLAMQSMHLQAPPTAPRVPGFPAAYCVYFDVATQTVRLRIHEWNWKGVCRYSVVTPDAAWRITYKRTKFWVDRLSLQLLREGDPPAGDDWQTLRALALMDWKGESAKVPKDLAVGVSQRAVEKYRNRKKAAVMALHTPPGFNFLPGCDRPAAYKVEGEEVTIITPRHDAHTKPAGASMKELFRIDRKITFGGVVYRGVSYEVQGDKLYRPGSPEDLWTTGDPSTDDALLVRENAPPGANILGDGQAWYVIVPGTIPKIEFHTYVRGLEHVKQMRIKAGVVQFKGIEYTVNPDGTLKGKA